MPGIWGPGRSVRMKPLFSIVMVSLNPGDKIFETLDSVQAQTCKNYQIIIKDGGSKDGTKERLQEYLYQNPDMAQRICLVETPDKSIYDGMNQALEYVEGDFVYFLNCGDSFYASEVLARLEPVLVADLESGEALKAGIYYGDQYDMLQQTVVASNPHIDAFACYRNVPCHQVCIYHREMFAERGYKPQYKVRGDYEHFLWCFFEKGVRPKYVPVTIANYEGGGFSETKENRKRSAREHEEITALYMSSGQRFKYRMILLLTLAPLRTLLAHNKAFSGVYNKLKGLVYGR